MISKACGRILFIFCVISSVSHASAQGPPIQTDTPIMLGLEGRGIRTFGKIIRQATLLREGTEIEDPMGRSVTLLLTPLAVPYNFLSSRLQVGLVLPFMRIGVNSKEGEFSSTGLGDASIFAKYLVYQHDRRNKTIRVASKFGVKFPTGDEKAQPALGSGSTDYFISTVAGWIAGRMGIYLEGRFTWNTSREAINFGNAIFYNMAFGYRLLPIIYETYPSPQLNGFWK